MNRGKKTAINTSFGLIEEVISVICGLILPRLILSTFGSQYNGLTSSITQFLSCAVLLRSGIGGATRAALYKPLANNDKGKVDSIIKATDIFMKKIGLILAGAIVIFASIYPFFVSDEFDWFFTFSLFLIIGASTFAESFFGITYLILLQADQRLWVSSLLKSISYIANTVIAVILIYAGGSIHIVKLGSAFVYVIYPIVLSTYVKHHYRIDKHAKPDNQAISQRWDAFWHQVAAFVMNNTDVMVLTVFSNMYEVSVYSVYNSVISGLKRAITAMTGGLEAPFGNMIAKHEDRTVRKNLELVEYIMYSLCTFVYSVAAVLILYFVQIYTNGVSDVNYIRPAFAYIMLLAQFFNGIRYSYQIVVQAAGHYKQTKRGAIIEPILNLGISIALVIKFGLVGVAVGTLVATIFRTIQYSFYLCKNIVPRNQAITIGKIVLSFIETAVIVIIFYEIPIPVPDNYFSWFITAIIAAVIAILVIFIGSLIAYREELKAFIIKMKGILHRS